MPANKNKLLRMGVIIEMMRKNSFPNFTRFTAEMRRRDPAGAYKLSERTFRRDINDLKVEYDAPIEYDDSERGFFLTNPTSPKTTFFQAGIGREKCSN